MTASTKSLHDHEEPGRRFMIVEALRVRRRVVASRMIVRVIAPKSYDTVRNNVISHQGSWGVLIHDYPDPKKAAAHLALAGRILQRELPRRQGLRLPGQGQPGVRQQVR